MLSMVYYEDMKCLNTLESRCNIIPSAKIPGLQAAQYHTVGTQGISMFFFLYIANSKPTV